MIRKCKHCGSTTNSSDMYCTHCGQKLEQMTMETSAIDAYPNEDQDPVSSFSTLIANVLFILVIKWFTLPIQIVKNSYHILSEYKSDKSNNKTLSRDFPIYTWIIYVFDCWILLVYPAGIIYFTYNLISLEKDDDIVDVLFYSSLVIYFIPILYGLIKEWLQVILIALQKLYVIAHDETSK